MINRKKPLYRKENKKSLMCRANVRTGGESRWTRNSKAAKQSDAKHEGMNSKNLGYDYQPLYNFLLSKVGTKWDDVFSEAIKRLDKPDPLFWMVAENPLPTTPDIVRVGENSYYFQLFVDEDGILQILNPDAAPPTIWCTCCTYSFNGKPILPEGQTAE